MVDTPVLADRHMNPVTRAQPRARRENRAVQYSIVIPVFHEQDNIPELYERLTAVMQGLGGPYEIILVDDGSTDRSFPMMKALHEQDPRVKALNLSRNFGHHLTLTVMCQDM